jgi:hypothetical protein
VSGRDEISRKQAELEAHRENVWGIVGRRADHKGRVYTVVRSGQVLSPRRDIRREAKRLGLAPTGRQWVKLRKQMARSERIHQATPPVYLKRAFEAVIKEAAA